MQIEIPLIGTLANIIGLFLASLVTGIIGAIVLNLIDKFIARKLKSNIEEKKIDTANKILKTQKYLEEIAKKNNEKLKNDVNVSINYRHEQATEMMKEVVKKITNYKINAEEKEISSDNDKEFDDMDKILKTLGI